MRNALQQLLGRLSRSVAGLAGLAASSLGRRLGLEGRELTLVVFLMLAVAMAGLALGAALPGAPGRGGDAAKVTGAWGPWQLIYVAHDGLSLVDLARPTEETADRDPRAYNRRLLVHASELSLCEADELSEEVTLSLSPTGRFAVVADAAACRTSSFSLVDLENGFVKLVQRNLSGVPAWSPSGERFLNGAEVCDVRGVCQDLPVSVESAAWAGDESLLVAVKPETAPGAPSPSPLRDLVLVTLGSKPRPLHVQGYRPQVSPDGRYVAYWYNVDMTGDGWNGDLAVLDLTRPGAQPVELGHRLSSQEPAWLPSLGQHVFGGVEVSTAQSVKPRDEAGRPVWFNDANDVVGQPIAASDTSSLVLGARQNSAVVTYRLLVASNRGGSWAATQLEPSLQRPLAAAVAPNGSFAAYLRQAPGYGWLIRPDGSHVRELMARSLLGFSTDGAWLATVPRSGVVAAIPSDGRATVEFETGLECSENCERVAAWRPAALDGARAPTGAGP